MSEYKYKKTTINGKIYYSRYTKEQEKAQIAEIITEKAYYNSPVFKAELIKRRLVKETDEKK